MPNDRPMYVNGFVAYREYHFANPHTFEPESARDEHECYTEEQAKQAVATLKLEFPDDTVYYEACSVLL